MTPTASFLFFLILTVALLAAVVCTGMRGHRRVHLVCVASTLASLGTTIYFAEKLGKFYDLDSAGWITPVHLGVAKVTVVAYLLPIVTGLLTWRNASWKPRHRLCAFLVLGLTLLTAATGSAMLLVADPIPAAAIPQ